MAGLIDPKSISTARQAGYSDPEIASFLTEKHPDQFMMAREAGYSDTEILQHLSGAKGPAAKPSGMGAGFMQGLANVPKDIGATLKTFAGMDTGLEGTAAKIAPNDYKAAPLIREGGSFLNASDYNPSALPQIIAEQAPGVGMDLALVKTVGKVNKWAGLAAGAGSAMLRTLGPMAKENAKARTGDENAEVTAEDKQRALLTSAAQAPLTAIGLSRFAPGAGKAVGVGMAGAGSALKKYAATVGTEAATGAARDAIGQVGTSVGQEYGKDYDPNQGVTSAVTGAAGGGLLASPRLVGNLTTASKFRNFGGDNAEAATALANRVEKAADGTALVGPIGGTKTAARSVAAADKDVRTELTAAAKGETGLSTANNNTLTRIQDGGKASASELTALGTEVSPTTLHLARQALLSSQLKGMGNFSENAFTGGLSGKLEKLRPVAAPVATAAAVGAGLAGGTAGLGMLGTFSPGAVGGILGTYAGARMLDKFTGARSPAKVFVDKFANPNAPDVVNPAAPAPAMPQQATTSVPQVTPPQNTSLWGDAAPKFNPRPNIMIDEGIGKAVKQIQAAKQKQLIAETMPALRDLAAQQGPNAKPLELPADFASTLGGRPPPVAPAASPPPIDAFDALKPLMGRQRAIMRGLSAANKQQVSDNAAQRKAAGVNQAERLADESPLINEQGGLDVLRNPEFAKRGSQILSAANVMKKLTAEPSEKPEAAAAALAQPGPASPEISALMQKLRAKSAPAAPPEAPAAPLPPPMVPDGPTLAPGPSLAPPAPVPPVIAKITKKLKSKKVEETAKEAPFEKEYVPLADEQLWGRGMDDQKFAQTAAAKRTDLRSPEGYTKGIVRDRQARRGAIAEVIGTQTGKNATHAAALLDQLHHVNRAAEAAAAVKYFTQKMTPKTRTLVRAKLDHTFINTIWKT